MKPFSLLVKPASALCNINCRYCFYKRALELYPQDIYTRKMSRETAENMIRKFLGMKFPAVSICFQGGEPLLMGLDFYKQVIEFERTYGFPGQNVGNSFQTNGILINDEWADFFAQYNMLIGISLDGPSEVHDHDRVTYNGGKTFDKVMAAIHTLKRKKVEFNILSMITTHSAPLIEKTYSFMRSQGFNHLQFIPCVEQDPKTNKPSVHTITDAQYGTFYTKLFDLWYADGYPDVSIRMFDDILVYLIDGDRPSCSFQKSCTSYFLIEHNGDVYPCDFYAYDKWKLGNINEDEFLALSRSERRAEFAKLKTQTSPHCRGCEYYAFCNGDCTKFRVFLDNAPSNVSWLCPGFKEFLLYSMPRFLELKEDVLKRRAQNAAATPPPPDLSNYPRNAPCPCGSGKKYKKCCGKGKA